MVETELLFKQTARRIIQPGNIDKNNQVNSIFLSSLYVKSVNVALEKLCLSNKFIFIDNSNIIVISRNACCRSWFTFEISWKGYIT